MELRHLSNVIGIIGKWISKRFQNYPTQCCCTHGDPLFISRRTVCKMLQKLLFCNLFSPWEACLLYGMSCVCLSREPHDFLIFREELRLLCYFCKGYQGSDWSAWGLRSAKSKDQVLNPVWKHFVYFFFNIMLILSLSCLV